MTAGVDYDWRLGQRWSLTGTWAGSHVAGSAVAIAALQQNNVHSFQRPDADHVDFDPLARLDERATPARWRSARLPATRCAAT